MKSMQMRGIVAAVSGALLMGAAHVALADSTDDLLKMLRDKGVLTQDEFDEFNATRDVEKVKKTSEIKASFKDGISWQSGDGATKLSVNGRIQADYRTFDNPDTNNKADTADTWDIRRAYFGVKGTFYNNINFEVTTDLGSDVKDGNKGYIKYAWLEAAYWEAAKLRFGQFKAPFGLEQLTSSRFIDFTERDWGATLAPGVDRGAMLHGSPIKGLTYGISFMNGGLLADGGQNNNEKAKTTDGKEITGRVTANIAQLASIQDMILHIGADYSKGNDLPDTAGSDIKFRTNGRGTQFFAADKLTSINPDVRREGLEGIVAYGPVKLQSEWYSWQLEPSGGTGSFAKDKEIKTWYADVSWLITGEKYSDAYKDGVMDRIKPKNDFIAPGAPGWGAWEVGVRYSKFDAKDFKEGIDFTSAKYSNDVHSWSAGLRWIPNPNTRFMLDYIDTSFDHDINGGATTKAYDNEKAINLRAQFDF